MNQLQVKVCGITTPEGLDACLEAGVEYVGLNFVPASKRRVDPKTAQALCARAQGALRMVGVFQNPRLDELHAVLRAVPLDAVQLHGDESPEFCASLPLQVWKAFGVHDRWDAALVGRYKGLAVRLFDTSTGGQSGGIGRPFDWALLPTTPLRPWFLAGGLNPGNLAAAVATCHPDGVDLNSGIETAPGIKDAELLKQAMKALHPWRQPQPTPIGLPGERGAPVRIEGESWPSWKVSSQWGVEDQEWDGVMGLLEEFPRLVLDYRKRPRIHERLHILMRIQNEARARGRRVKFQLCEETIEALLRVSVMQSLDIIE